MSTSDSESHITTVKTILSIAGTIAATVVVVRGVAQEFLPSELQDYFYSGARKMFNRLSNELTVVVEESDGLDGNEIYEAAKIYLESKIGATMRRLKISKNKKEKHMDISMERDEEVVDVYNGQKFKWVWVSRRMEGHVSQNPRLCEMRSFELTFHKRNRKLVIDSYLPFIIDAAKTRKREKKTLRIFTADYQNNYDMSQIWKPVTLNHPSTFETLAMDSDEKDMILKDIERFLGRREYYRKVGKAWKRGYLLYGPPGTGKSSLIAAMANYLNFDVYDLELTELTRNSNLRNVLLATADKSILVVEDIDCAIDLNEKLANRDDSFQGNHHPNESQVTLSGLLNLIDGLWSSCGDERIIIFTTNHIEKLDPALLRPGRMDVHIHMSYCSPCGFKQLASNYLGIKDHPLFQQIQDLLANVKATPAEVAEQLLKNDDPDSSLQGLLDFLHEKMVRNEEAEAEKAKAAAETAEKRENARQRNMEKRSMVC